MSLTIGEMIANADARFAEQGGYKATAHCGARRVELIHQSQDGLDIVVSSAPMVPGIAPEDIGHELLAAEIGKEAATDAYFVITISD